jgi:hypothetical protein
MMRYFLYLLLYIPVQLFAYLITPILPAFRVLRLGKSDNANAYLVEPRLPEWLSFLDTPDNSLWGDHGWQTKHCPEYASYWGMVKWLYRNSLYGFKWSVMSMPVQQERAVVGDPAINHHTKTFGTLCIVQPNGAWQYKCVMPFCGKILVLNLGWLLDDCSQERALFMFSPRLK